MIFLHGALGSREQLLPLAEVFRRDRQIFALDFSGHGSRAQEGGEFSIGRFAGDLISFLDSEEIDRADMFGYSMGGYVALYAARHNPGRVGRIMTLGTKFDWNGPTAQNEASRLDPAVMEKKVPAFVARLRSLHGEAWTQVVGFTARMMLELGAAPALSESDFQSVPNRALLSVGEYDEMVTVGETERTARLLPAGELMVIPGMRHPIERADRDLLVSSIAEFFSGGGTSATGSSPHISKTSIEQTP